MNEIIIEAKLVKAVSQKNGNEYPYVQLTFPNGYQTRIFFKQAEAFLLLGLFN